MNSGLWMNKVGWRNRLGTNVREDKSTLSLCRPAEKEGSAGGLAVCRGLMEV